MILEKNFAWRTGDSLMRSDYLNICKALVSGNIATYSELKSMSELDVWLLAFKAMLNGELDYSEPKGISYDHWRWFTGWRLSNPSQLDTMKVSDAFVECLKTSQLEALVNRYIIDLLASSIDITPEFANMCVQFKGNEIADSYLLERKQLPVSIENFYELLSRSNSYKLLLRFNNVVIPPEADLVTIVDILTQPENLIEKLLDWEGFTPVLDCASHPDKAWCGYAMPEAMYCRGEGAHKGYESPKRSILEAVHDVVSMAIQSAGKQYKDVPKDWLIATVFERPKLVQRFTEFYDEVEKILNGHG